MEWRRYVPVAERRVKAGREMKKLCKKGGDIQPIEIERRAIARSFWGKRWCEHLESFSAHCRNLMHPLIFSLYDTKDSSIDSLLHQHLPESLHQWT